MLSYFHDELEKMAKAGMLAKAVGSIGKGLGKVFGGAKRGATSAAKKMKGTVIRTKGEFRRGAEIAKGVSPQPRLQANIAKAKQVAVQKEMASRAAGRQAQRTKLRNVLMGTAVGGTALGAGAVGAHKLLKKKEPQQQFPSYYQ